ncbi:MAG: 4-hydroxyphenylacetate decarboxylase large subunit [Bacteroidetes bacterium]|nr:4-hydroxyphenylacetate decarboxylase large subunit [Bacteroidota bacterium]MBL6943542.1 4-hydroxyphenylacetate decarboxylase large subunit [Bacteroidales bacterium]
MSFPDEFLECSAINYYGNAPQGHILEREIVKNPTQRVEKIRNQYFETKSSASIEFPYWYTRKWEELEGEVPIVRRAEALKTGFEHLTPVIYPGELLVMGKANYLRGSYPMPWLSEAFFLAKEDEMYKEALEAGKVSSDEVTTMGQGGGNVTKSIGNVISIAGKFGMRKEEMPMLLRIAKKWHNKSVDDIGHKYEQLVPGYSTKEEIMRAVICMFDSGYTLPQGREVMNYYYPLQYGINGILKICKEKIDASAGYPNMDRKYFYKSIETVLLGIQKWIKNHADEARFMASLEKDNNQLHEYLDIAERLDWLSHNPPRDFHDALQLTWIFHVAVLNEDAISGLSPGRLGQVLYPYWKQDMDEGKLDKEKTIELLETMRMKFTQLDCFASMGVVGGVLSGNTFNNLCVGGLTKDGNSAANELEILIMESSITCDTPQPTLSLLYDEKLPEEFLLKGIETTKVGTGYPAWVNNRVAMEFIMENFKNEGMEMEEARAWSIGGCLETSAGSWMPLEFNGEIHYIPGGSAPATSVGVHFISVPKVLEAVLYNGIDRRTGRRVYPAHGKKLSTYEELWETFKEYFSLTVEVLTLTNNIQHDIWGKISPSIVNSMLKPDCLETGKDISHKGSRYNRTFNVEVCGGVNLVNSLASVKKNVYVEKNFSLANLKDAIDSNFGYFTAQETGSYSLIEQKRTEKYEDWLKIHSQCLDAPKYGNDESFVDNIFRDWQIWFSKMCENYLSLYNEPLYSCQISVSTHAPMGAVTLATPDGRLSGTTFADGSVSAYPGTDQNGPYALFNSATCYNHALSQNSQLNMKIHPSVVAGREGSKKFLEMIKAYLRKGAFHAQFNIVDSRMLKDAQNNPDNYRGLMVRVAGFTQYWVELGKQIQDEVIARTEYEEI